MLYFGACGFRARPLDACRRRLCRRGKKGSAFIFAIAATVIGRYGFLSVGYCVDFLGVRLSRAIFFQKSRADDGFAVAGKKARRDFPLSRRR